MTIASHDATGDGLRVIKKLGLDCPDAPGNDRSKGGEYNMYRPGRPRPPLVPETMESSYTHAFTFTNARLVDYDYDYGNDIDADPEPPPRRATRDGRRYGC